MMVQIRENLGMMPVVGNLLKKWLNVSESAIKNTLEVVPLIGPRLYGLVAVVQRRAKIKIITRALMVMIKQVASVFMKR